MSGSILNIADAITGSVTMTAPFNRKTGRHVLGKVTIRLSLRTFSLNIFEIDQIYFLIQGKEVEICIEGTLPPNSGLSPPFAGLKNQAHGKVTWKYINTRTMGTT